MDTPSTPDTSAIWSVGTLSGSGEFVPKADESARTSTTRRDHIYVSIPSMSVPDHFSIDVDKNRRNEFDTGEDLRSNERKELDVIFHKRLTKYGSRLAAARSPGPPTQRSVMSGSLGAARTSLKKGSDSVLSAYGFLPDQSFTTSDDSFESQSTEAVLNPAKPRLRFALSESVVPDSDESLTRKTATPSDRAVSRQNSITTARSLRSRHSLETHRSHHTAVAASDKTEGLIKDVSTTTHQRIIIPSDPGIAVAPSDRTPPWKFLFFTIFWCLLALKLSIRVADRLVINDTINLTHNDTLIMHMRDCGIIFKPAALNESRIVINAWRHQMIWFRYPGGLFSDDHMTHVHRPSSKEVFIDIRRRQPSFYFKCSVYVYLDHSYVFKNVRIKYELADDYSEVVTESPQLTLRAADEIYADFVNAEVSFPRVVCPKVTLVQRDGQLTFGYPRPNVKDPYLKLVTGTAVVVIHTNHPLRLHLPVEDVIRLLVQTDGTLSAYYSLQEKHDFVHLHVYPKGSTDDPVRVRAYLSGTPLYIKSCKDIFDPNFDPNTILQTWGGQLQAETPKLTTLSLSRVSEIPSWVALAPQTPWLLYAKVLGSGMPKGRWKFVSTGALLGHNIDMILLAAGILDPRTAYMRLHILGIYCPVEHEAKEAISTLRRKTLPRQLLQAYAADLDAEICLKWLWPWSPEINTPAQTVAVYLGETHFGMDPCLAMLLESQFRVFWETFQDIQAPSILPLWVDETRQETLFDLVNDTLLIRKVDWSLTWRFTIAIILNLGIGCGGAWYLSANTLNDINDTFYDGYMLDEAVSVAASWRLDSAIGKRPTQEWHINVSRYLHYSPKGGFVIRWTSGGSLARFSYIAVLVRDAAESKEQVTQLSDSVDESAGSRPKKLLSWVTLRRDELLLFFPIKSVKNVRTLSGNQKELKIPAAHHGFRHKEYETEQRWTLKLGKRYRVKLLGCDKLRCVTSASSWSDAHVLYEVVSPTDWAVNLYRVFNVHKPPSLPYFIHKFCRPVSPYNLAFLMQNLHILRELRPEAPTSVYLKLLAFCVEPKLLMKDSLRQKVNKMQSTLTVRGTMETIIRRQPSQRRQGLHSTVLRSLHCEGEISLELSPLSHPTFVVCLVDGHSNEISASTVVYCDYVIKSMVTAAVNGADVAYVDMPMSDLKGNTYGSLRGTLATTYVQPFISRQNYIEHRRSRRPYFDDHLTAAILQIGEDFSLTWSPPGLYRYIYVHLVDAYSGCYIQSLRGGAHIPNSGAFVWAVDVPLTSEQQRFRAVYLLMTDTEFRKGEALPVIAKSNTFFVVRTLTLCEFEFAYASFCRINHLDMQHVSKEFLVERNFRVENRDLRVISNLRRPLPFECEYTDVVYSVGQGYLGAVSKLVSLKSSEFSDGRPTEARRNQAVSIEQVINAKTVAALYQGLSEDRVDIFKSISCKLPCILNFAIDYDPYWWVSSPDIRILSYNLMPYQPWLLTERGLIRALMPWNQQEYTEDCSRFFIYNLTDEEFERDRYWTYVIWPHIMSGLDMSRLPFSALWGFTLLGTSLLHSLSVHELRRDRSQDLDSSILVDIAFSEDKSAFFFSMNGFHLLIACLTIANFVTSALYSIASPYLTSFLNIPYDPLYMVLVLYYFTLIWLAVSLTVVAMSWLLVAGLVNTSRFAPIAVMIASVAFGCYSVVSSFSEARETIYRFIITNTQKLVGVSLDYWFDNDLPFNDWEEEADTRVVDPNRIISDTLKACQIKARSLLAHMEEESRANTKMIRRRKSRVKPVSQDYETTDDAKEPRHVHIQAVDQPPPITIRNIHNRPEIRWKVQVIMAPYDSAFTVTSTGIVQGLDGEFHIGGRLVSLREAITKADRIIALLDVGEVVLVHGGSIHLGSEGQYRFKRWPLSELTAGQQLQYRLALLAYPKYPDPSVLTAVEKVSLIFDYFDTNQDGIWSKKEYQHWVAVCGREQDTAGVSFALDELLSFEIAEAAGCKCRDVYSVYIHMADKLDRDYKHLFIDVHPMGGDPTDGFSVDGLSIRNLSESDDSSIVVDEYEVSTSDYGEAVTEPLSEEESIELSEQTESHEADAMRSSKTREWDSSSSTSHDSEKEGRPNIDTELKNNFNAKKLLAIFKRVAEKGDDKQIAALVHDRRGLASKVYDTKWRLLLPIFSTQAVMKRAGTLQADGSEPLGAGFTRALITLQQSLEFNLSMSFFRAHYELTNITSITAGVSEFYDEFIIDRVQFKAHSLLKPTVELTVKDVHPANAPDLAKFPPKTAFHLFRLLAQHQISKDDFLQAMCSLAACAGHHQRSVQTSALTVLLKECGLISSNEISLRSYENAIFAPPSNVLKRWHTALTPCNVYISTNNGHLRLPLPKSSACTEFLESVIEDLVPIYKFTPEDIIACVKYIGERFLWMDAFFFLVRLLGISVQLESLPGAQLRTEETRSAIRPTAIPSGISQKYVEEVQFQKALEKSNVEAVKRVFAELNGGTHFLPVHLADEAILLLTDNQMNFSAAVVCLQRLGLDVPVSAVFASDDMADALSAVGITPNSSNVVSIKSSNETQVDHFDWTVYALETTVNEEVYEEYLKLTIGSNGFATKSQMIEFARCVSERVLPRAVGDKTVPVVLNSAYESPDELRKSKRLISTVRSALRATLSSIHEESDSQRVQKAFVTYEMFHRVLMRDQLAFSRKHTQLLWSLICAQQSEEMQRVLSIDVVPVELCKILLQPRTAKGLAWHEGESLEAIKNYDGCITFRLFQELLKLLDVTVGDQGARTMWSRIPKGYLNVSSYLDVKLEREGNVLITAGRDSRGMDPYQGKLASIKQVNKKLFQFLTTGLWPAAVVSLLSLNLDLSFTCLDGEELLQKLSPSLFNSYGLLKPKGVVRVLLNLQGEGMTYATLERVIQDMRVNLPKSSIRRMFSLMDSNHDMSLDIDELIGGFSILFSHFIPGLIVDSLGCSVGRQIKVVLLTLLYSLVFFTFLALSFQSFSQTTGSAGSIIQSLLALGGAISLQSGTRKDGAVVEREMKTKMATLLGDSYDVMLEDQDRQLQHYAQKLALEKGKREEQFGVRPIEIRYLIPAKFMSTTRDNYMTLRPGDSVRLEPIIVGKTQIDTSKLVWTIKPILPSQLSLTFSSSTGVIVGTIPNTADGFTELALPSPSSSKTLSADDLSPLFYKKLSFLVTCHSMEISTQARLTFRVVPDYYP